MITEFFAPTLRVIDLNYIWFQHDGATCNTTHATIDLLRQTFNRHLIRRTVMLEVVVVF